MGDVAVYLECVVDSRFEFQRIETLRSLRISVLSVLKTTSNAEDTEIRRGPRRRQRFSWEMRKRAIFLALHRLKALFFWWIFPRFSLPLNRLKNRVHPMCLERTQSGFGAPGD